MGEAEANRKQGRRWLPLALIVLATIVGIVSVFALWAKRQLLETETWGETSEELIQNAEIQNALSDFVVRTIYDNVDVEQELANRLPPQLAPLAGPVAGALRNAADDIALRALQQPQVQGLFVDASEAAQSRLIDLIEDRGDFVSTTGGDVTLDLTSVVESVTSQLGVGEGLAARLPAEASSIQITESDELATAQRAVNALQTLAYVLTALTLLLFAAAIFLAGDRRRETLRSVGIAFIVIGVVVLFARGLAGNAVVSSLSEAAANDAAVDATWTIATSLLLETGQSIIAYGIVILLAAWLTGPTRSATSIRHAVTPYLRQPRYAYGGLAALLVLLFWWDPVIATHRLVPSLVLIAFAVLGTEMLRRQVIREFPDRVTTGSAAGVAQGLAERMREARERRVATAAPGPAAPSPPGDARVAELERLAKLRDSEVLTDEEFAAEKQRLLGS